MTLKQRLAQKLESTDNISSTQEEKQLTESVAVLEEDNIIPFSKGQAIPAQVLPELEVSIEQAKQRLKMLQQFVQEMMIAGVDYGLVPGCPKPSLFKAGAEKLTDIFGFSKELEVINRIEDWERGFFSYEVKVILKSKRTGHIEAEGVGSCNSKEKKYKSQDAYSIVNTILKMAKKRAIVDAVLSATRSSGLFTQDIEDMDVLPEEELNKNTISSNKPSTTPNIIGTNSKPASQSQFKLISKLIAEKSFSAELGCKVLKEKFGLSESKELSSSQASEFIQYLMNLPTKTPTK